MNFHALHMYYSTFHENPFCDFGKEAKIWYDLHRGWPWPQGHAYSRSQNELQCFTLVPYQVWWKSVERYNHYSHNTYMTFDLGMTPTSRSCMKWAYYKLVPYKIWWESKREKRYLHSSQNSKSDPWPWSDLDLWPTKNLVPSDECPKPIACSYQIW